MDNALPIVIFAVVLIVVTGYFLKQRLSGPGASEPQRLAKLLVTEIKLYNQDALEEAKGGDIYSRLRDDIERARQSFEERVAAEDRADHFETALVEILAEGDASALGSR